MKRNNYHYWIKLQRRYRKIQARWAENKNTRLARKLDITGRRLHALNRKWKLGIATTALAAWLAMMPTSEIKAQDFPTVFDLSTLDGSNGFVLNGVNTGDNSGSSVSSAGDVNGDGVDDLLIGAPGANSNVGETYVVFGQTTAFPASMNLSGLDGSNGFVLNGVDIYDNSGRSVSGAGDVNGDGVDDLIIGASGAASNGNSDEGETYVVFGQTSGFPASMELSSLDGTTGFVLNGVDVYDHSGRPVSGAGDVNGDGVGDLLIGAQLADPNDNSQAGETYVVFGQTSDFPASMNLSGLDGSNGFVLNGIDFNDRSAFSVSGAGDVNGDGVDDLLIGARSADPNGNSYAGETYVLFGQMTSFPASMELSGLDGSNGFVLNGIDEWDESGFSVSGAGDVNGDGVDDLLIGAYSADPNGSSSAGETYVVFGQTGGFPATMNLSGLDGSNGFVINGIAAYDYSGRSVSGAGDVNGDGVDDLLIGAGTAEDNSQTAGETYVVFGQTTAFSASMNLSGLDGSNGFVLNGIDIDDHSGNSVSEAGDVNGDGVDDLLIGASGAGPNGTSFAGETYVVFGIQGPNPVVANSIPDQQTEEDQIFDFMIPANTFNDIDDDVLTLSATLAGGDTLPSWLSFTPGASTFSGTPVNDDVGTISIEVTATDPGGLFVRDVFDLEVVNTNDAPILASIGLQSGDEGTEITFTASATDVDLPANTLTFSLDVTSTGKGMTIDSATGAFSWTPAEGQDGNHDVIVTVSDGIDTDSELVTIAVTELPLGTNELSSINLYPNPAKDQLEIVGLADARTATFYSLAGVRVLDVEVKGNFVDVRALKNGVFVVEIKDAEGLVIFKSRLLKAN
ncbi:MAG: hypothetical protein GY816_02305 [Cytophagales bacterium]|nr:hypothetical protein [Cytophagales bacterium]